MQVVSKGEEETRWEKMGDRGFETPVERERERVESFVI